MDWTQIVAALAGLGGCGAALRYLLRVRPRRVRSWVRPPDLRVSRDVPDSVRQAAIRAWSTLRYGLQAPVGISDSYSYGGPIPMDGEIVVVYTESWQSNDHPGHCEVWHYDERDQWPGRIRRARVKLPIIPNPKTAERVALHELLCALGYKPVALGGHALTRSHRRGGDSLSGLYEDLHRK